MDNEIIIEWKAGYADLDDDNDDCYYDESYYDTDLDAAADRILNQFDTDYMYQESIIGTAIGEVAGWGLVFLIQGLRLAVHPSDWSAAILMLGSSEWAPFAAGVSAVAIGTYVAAFKGITTVVRICKSGKNVHKDLCEIADMVSSDKSPEPKKVYKAFKNLKKDLKALKMRFHAFTEEERKVMGDLIDSTNKIITMTKSDATNKEKIKTIVNDFLQDAKKVDDIIANPAKKQEMVKA